MTLRVEDVSCNKVCEPVAGRVLHIAHQSRSDFSG
jgi:hypothetical protein